MKWEEAAGGMLKDGPEGGASSPSTAICREEAVLCRPVLLLLLPLRLLLLLASAPEPNWKTEAAAKKLLEGEGAAAESGGS